MRSTRTRSSSDFYLYPDISFYVYPDMLWGKAQQQKELTGCPGCRPFLAL